MREQLEKLELLKELSKIPCNDGEQWIYVMYNISWGRCDVHFSFNWKKDSGVYESLTVDEAIEKVKALRVFAKL